MRDEWRDTLLGLAVLAMTILPVALYQMEQGSALERLLAALALWGVGCAFAVGVVRVITSRAIVGIAMLVLGLLVLYGLDAAGVFESVGL